MARFFATARYCTPGGNQGDWSETVEADDIGTALRRAQSIFERRHRGVSKIDIAIAPDIRLGPANDRD
ncbi:hypothetical protein [Sphingomonas sp. YL-JM2C]